MIKKIEAGRLEEGMYLSQMDKPWFETPFLRRKFLINSKKQIEKLRQYCEYVYIDTDKGVDAPDAPTKEEVDKKIVSEIQKLIKIPESEQKRENIAAPPSMPNKQEIEVAKKIRFETKKTVSNLFEDVRLGKNVDSIATKAVVGGLIDSILRDKDALICLSHLKQKDEYTSIHSMNVSIISLAFGHHLGLSKSELANLGLGGLLHDVGKSRVPVGLINKPGTLTEAEFEIMKTHVNLGVSMIGRSPGIPPEAILVAAQHHERHNGKGYPNGLKGDKISLMGAISSIVDVYDAITTNRAYHDAISAHEALKLLYELARDRGDFNISLVEKFIQCMGIYPIASLIELNTGDIGVVVSVNRASALKPKVLLVLKPDLTRHHPMKMIDILTDKIVVSGQPWEIRKVLKHGDHNLEPMKILQQNGMI